jgi:hypothetical protein
MQTLNIEILNPKAKKLIMDLVDLKLIAIKDEPDSFLKAVNKIRSKKAKITATDIVKEVESVRANRYAK